MATPRCEGIQLSSGDAVERLRDARDALDQVLADVANRPPLPNLVSSRGMRVAEAIPLRARGKPVHVGAAIGFRWVDEGERVEISTTFMAVVSLAEPEARRHLREMRRLGFRCREEGCWVATLDANDELGIDRAVRVATKALLIEGM